MRNRITDDRRHSGLILFLVIAAGLALGAWLAVWVAGNAAPPPQRGEPASKRNGIPGRALDAPGFEILQVLQAGAPRPSLRLLIEGAKRASTGYPRILLVALPTFSPRHRALLFIRPADPGLCRSLHGTELAEYWHGPEPVGVCAVGDPPDAESREAAVGLLLRRSS